ncbi:hypothetical protein WA538_004200, partial [Blastocystis sp. DL]
FTSLLHLSVWNRTKQVQPNRAFSRTSTFSQKSQAMSGGTPFRYPKYVWSPAGGWWAQNANWKRNTKVAALVMVCCCIPVFLTSIKLERRPQPPTRHILSQKWCKHAKEDDPSLQ